MCLEEQRHVLPHNLSGTVPPGQLASWREPRHREGCVQPGGTGAHSYSHTLTLLSNVSSSNLSFSYLSDVLNSIP